jgi:hypothetical protein
MPAANWCYANIDLFTYWLQLPFRHNSMCGDAPGLISSANVNVCSHTQLRPRPFSLAGECPSCSAHTHDWLEIPRISLGYRLPRSRSSQAWSRLQLHLCQRKVNLVEIKMLGRVSFPFDLAMLLHHQISCRSNLLSMNLLSLNLFNRDMSWYNPTKDYLQYLGTPLG